MERTAGRLSIGERRLRSITFAAALLSGTLAPAFAQTQTQKNVMNHVAQAIVVSNGCSSLKPRMLLMSMLLQKYKIDIDRSPFKEFMKDRGEYHAKAMSKYSEEIVCVTGRTLYGDKGQNVPNLLEQ